MEHLNQYETEVIGVSLGQILLDKLGVYLEPILYDTTNSFTYIAEENTKSLLAQHDKDKAKRDDFIVVQKLSQFYLYLS